MSLEKEMKAALATFVEEARELLQDMEDGLLGLEHEEDPLETVNAVFRAAHTIKGSSGLFGLEHIVRFTHVLESVLDRLRNEELQVTSELVGCLLPCADHLNALMSGVAHGQLEESPELAAQEAGLLAGLRGFLEGDGGRAGDGPDDRQADAPGSGPEAAAGRGGPADRRRRLHLSLRFGSNCLRNGMDPLAFIRYLNTLGEVVALSTLDDLLPPAEEFDPEASYLDFEITLLTDAPIETVTGVFDFVAEESQIRVLGPQDQPSQYADLVRAQGELAPRVREILVRTGAIDAAALAQALGEPVPATESGPATAAQPEAGRQPEACGEGPAERSGNGSLLERIPAQTRTPSPVPAQPGSGGDQGTGSGESAGGSGSAAGSGNRDARTIRIDATRLDRLIDAVGELVIAGASAGLRASLMRDESLVTSIGEVMRLVEEVRDSALQLRMVPIGTTFSRFQRVVRDVSADLGKDIALVISGGDTEVDKALVEQIGDPLMHLVRNSMDHGIESPGVRLERGKPARGTLRLNAFHDSGSIVIEVSDDGSGIDTQAVLTKAIERGLVEPGTVLSDQEICQLIFEPGFSTAEQVSNLSGRGVGMDVVKRNVTALRGTIDIENRPGRGSTMRIRLPLTLAIIDGFQVGVGGASFVVPLDQVIECVELPPSAHARDCMDLRGEVLPFIRLRSQFGIAGERPRRENVVVVEYAGMKIGLVVDALMGEFQTVIKPLSRVFEHVQGIGGSTILGNGDVALIIDVPMLVRHYGDRQGAAQFATAGSRE
ncbi:MAG TPA: chemotaxis protein CheA [Kineosporiaceae bacterium]|nr:chemotaxis protein CheA [Kineosporiaceae bacterium]